MWFAASIEPFLQLFFENTVMGGEALCMGGSSGIGQAIAIELARRGFNITVVGRNIERGNQTIELLEEAGASKYFLCYSSLRSVVGVAVVSLTCLLKLLFPSPFFSLFLPKLQPRRRSLSS